MNTIEVTYGQYTAVMLRFNIVYTSDQFHYDQLKPVICVIHCVKPTDYILISINLSLLLNVLLGYLKPVPKQYKQSHQDQSSLLASALSD